MNENLKKKKNKKQEKRWENTKLILILSLNTGAFKTVAWTWT